MDIELEKKPVAKPGETKTIVNRFYEQQRRYYNNQIDDEQLTEITTQPFWQSMRLSKRRLEEKGLTMDIAVREKEHKSNVQRSNIKTLFLLVSFIASKGDYREEPDDIDYGRDGANFVENNTSEVVTERSYFLGGKKIYKKSEHEICSVNVLSTEVNGEDAACPNCGHVGKISGFIDGCEYCGSKFTVQDFEPKISGFALEENMRQRMQKTLLKTGGVLGIFTVLVAIIAAVLLGIFFVSMSMGAISTGTIGLFLGFTEAMRFLMGAFSTLWALVILILVMSGWVIPTPKQIKGKKIVLAVMEDFSFRDFFQNLEYKLRNIHLTDKAQEVKAFAAFDLTSTVADYKDVVDCQMRSIKFLAARPTTTGYEIDLEANLKLSVFDGKRIRAKYETLKLTVFGKKEILIKSTAAIREYKCPNCASSINLLEGGTCQYCGTQFAYENYGWKLLRYEKIQRVYAHTWLSLFMIVLYIMIFAYNYKNANVENSDLWDTYQEMQVMGERIKEFFDDVPSVEALGYNVTLTSQTEKYASRRTMYSVQDAETVAEGYKQVLLREGFALSEQNVPENAYYMYQEVEYQGESAYLCVDISFADMKLLVVYTIRDTIE